MKVVKSENIGITNITVFKYDKVSIYGGEYAIFKNGIEIFGELCLDAAIDIFKKSVAAHKESQRTHKYRIQNREGRIMHTGTKTGSWFNLERAKEIVDYSKGEMIYEYNENQVPLWEVL
jgi:hypothetical protein